MTITYTLDEHGQPVPCDDPIEWAMWMAENPDRRIAQDMDEADGSEPIRVSTIFLGVDSGLGSILGHPPLLWETMVFGGALDHHIARYATRDDALAGHQEMCALVSERLRRETP